MNEEPLGRWQGSSADELAEAWGVPRLCLYQRVGSTNDVAKRLAAAGAPHGTVVLAEEQTAGRGRGGQGWSSPPGVGVWLSLVIRPGPKAPPPPLPLSPGLAVARALDAVVAPAVVLLKWPNDLYLGEGKFAGLLCEGSWGGEGANFLIIGIGINVNQRAGDFPPGLRERATSLSLAVGHRVDRAGVADRVVKAVLKAAGEVGGKLSGGEQAEVERRDLLVGRRVSVNSGGSVVEGDALGVAPDGALLVRDRSGRLRRVLSGSVTVR
ncbi:MAG: biotin--[acetyl-CoA-carboxylase] ligase [Longimicrobiaceae bacterium]